MATHPFKERQTRVINPESDVPVIYSNNVEITASNIDVRFRLGQIQDVADDVIDVKRIFTIYMSREHARAFCDKLTELLGQLEASLDGESKTK